MANSKRNAVAIVMVLFISASDLRAADSVTLVLHVADYTNLPRSILETAEIEATRVYAAAGIDILWVNPGENVIDPRDDVRHLRLALLTRERAQPIIDQQQLGADVLGLAVHRAGRAYMFCHRIAALGDRRDFAYALGRVMAHETGHLVLPTSGHSKTGIMRALLDLSNRPQRFTPEQVAAILK